MCSPEAKAARGRNASWECVRGTFDTFEEIAINHTWGQSAVIFHSQIKSMWQLRPGRQITFLGIRGPGALETFFYDPDLLNAVQYCIIFVRGLTCSCHWHLSRFGCGYLHLKSTLYLGQLKQSAPSAECVGHLARLALQTLICLHSPTHQVHIDPS